MPREKRIIGPSEILLRRRCLSCLRHSRYCRHPSLGLSFSLFFSFFTFDSNKNRDVDWTREKSFEVEVDRSRTSRRVFVRSNFGWREINLDRIIFGHVTWSGYVKFLDLSRIIREIVFLFFFFYSLEEYSWSSRLIFVLSCLRRNISLNA